MRRQRWLQRYIRQPGRRLLQRPGVALGVKISSPNSELCGAEQNLIDRTKDEAAARKFISLTTRLQRVGNGNRVQAFT